MTKTEFRNQYKAVRLAMSREEVQASSQIICRKLLREVAGTNIKVMLVYKPIIRLNEVELGAFLEKIKNVETDTLSNNTDQPLPAKKYDLIIVPALAFDSENYRLGWGGGFYDRLLAQQPQALKIGLCFQNGFVKEGLPRKPYDIRLDKIITEV